MNEKEINIILSFFIIIVILVSTTIAISARTNNAFCILNSNCKEVQNSPYGQILGIKVGYLGFAAFILLGILYILARKNKNIYKLFLAANVLGSICALWFISVQIFILKAYCIDCLIVDSSMIIILFFSIYDYIRYKK